MRTMGTMVGDEARDIADRVRHIRLPTRVFQMSDVLFIICLYHQLFAVRAGPLISWKIDTSSLSLFLVQLFVIFAVSMNVEKQLPFYELRSRVTLLTITKNVSGWNFDYSDGTSEGKVLS